MRNEMARATRGVSDAAPQRGVVLLVALIVLLLMGLGATALVRSVDTSNVVVGTLAFRQASFMAADLGIEAAAAALFADSNKGAPMLVDPRADAASQNYYATHANAAGWDNAYGVPLPLQTPSDARALALQFDDGAGNTITYMIERLCNADAPVIPADRSAAPSWCNMTESPAAAPTSGGPPLPASHEPLYRVTVRVDGPQRAISFVQAVLGTVPPDAAGGVVTSGQPPRHRLSWRLLGA